ncbi:MAG: S8 family serine peptidase, partial [Chitinophagaceae bacterium]
MPKNTMRTSLPPQVIVMLKDDTGPVLNRMNAASNDSQAPEAKLQQTLKSNGLTLVPLFGESEASVASMVAKATTSSTANPLLKKMNSFYTLELPPQSSAQKTVEELLALDIVEAAYLKPAGEPPFFIESKDSPIAKVMEGGGLPITDNLTINQTYLNAAPGGVDASFAWTIAGGRGDGVGIIDVEGGWNFSHEDLAVNSGGMISGFNHTTDPDWFQHGTAVLGEMGGDVNTKGVTGICPNSQIRTISVFTNAALAYNSAAAMRTAADSLRAGDVMLIEQHRAGPNYPGGQTQMGFIAMEWWPDDFLAIQYATSKGVIVVEAAGNGSQNLNDVKHSTRPPGFPAWWTNPFNRAGTMDSGAIIVGAGAPPPGTNGFTWGVDRSRLGFSCYGSCVDAQGWGAGVTTTGYGGIHGTVASNQNEWYTNTFNGTSSASPIVTGVVASLQGIQRAAGRPILTPARMRQLLRTTGSPQQAGTGTPVTQRIGNRPNLRQLVAQVQNAPHWAGVQFTGVLNPNVTGNWFTHSWPDNWQVLWTVVPTAPIVDGNAQIEFTVQVDRQAFGFLKYFIKVTNLQPYPVTFEARFC